MGGTPRSQRRDKEKPDWWKYVGFVFIFLPAFCYYFVLFLCLYANVMVWEAHCILSCLLLVFPIRVPHAITGSFFVFVGDIFTQFSPTVHGSISKISAGKKAYGDGGGESWRRDGKGENQEQKNEFR